MTRWLFAAGLAAAFAPVAFAPVSLAAGGTPDPALDRALEGFEDNNEDRNGAELDRALEGFDDKSEDNNRGGPAPDTTKKISPAWDLDGAVTLSSSYNTNREKPAPGGADYRGLSRARGKLELILDGRFTNNWKVRAGGVAFYDAVYSIRGRGEHSEETLADHEKEARLKELYVSGSPARSLDLKLGRQIVVWGKSDNIRVTDVLNPLDNREPGMVDIEDLREPLFMTRLDFYTGDWNLTAIAIHEIAFHKLPAFGSDFFQGATPLPDGMTPPSSLDNTEFALALNGVFSRWDLSFYFAEVYDDFFHAERDGYSVKLKHSRVTMLGVSANVALGNWLLKTEAARFDGLEFYYAADKKTRIDVLGGVEYSGITDHTISVEVALRAIGGFEEAMKADPDLARESDYQTAIRYQADFVHDTVHLVALASFFGERLDGGGFQRVSVKYDVMDALSVTGGAVLYQSGSRRGFTTIGGRDRVFVDFKWSF